MAPGPGQNKRAPALGNGSGAHGPAPEAPVSPAANVNGHPTAPGRKCPHSPAHPPPRSPFRSAESRTCWALRPAFEIRRLEARMARSTAPGRWRSAIPRPPLPTGTFALKNKVGQFLQYARHQDRQGQPHGWTNGPLGDRLDRRFQGEPRVPTQFGITHACAHLG